jgi:hypothetical protein
MARTTSITYRLPRAVVVINGTVRRTHDQDLNPDKTLDKMPTRLISHAVEIRHEAEPSETRIVEAKGGWLFHYKASFAASEDGRLTKASTEATGVGAELVSAAATLAGVAVTAAGVPLGRADDPHLAAYKEEHSAEVAERDTLFALRSQARLKLQALVQQVIDDPRQSESLAPKLRHLREIQRSLDERIKALDILYQAWLATRVASVDDQFEIVVPLADLLGNIEQTQEKFGVPASESSPKPPTNMTDLWNRYGLTVLATWTSARETQNQPAPAATKVFARLAEPVTLSVVEHTEDIPVVTKRHRALVADSRSPIVSYELKRTLFGRRSLDLSFSANGYLTGVGVEGAATLGEAGKALAGAPAALASGIDSYTKAQTGIASAQRAGLESRLAQVKAEVELRQQQLLADGLDLTGSDAARLERLKQLQSILDTQSVISKADPSLVAALQAQSGHDLDWYSPPPPAPKEDNTLTVILQPGPVPES